MPSSSAVPNVNADPSNCGGCVEATILVSRTSEGKTDPFAEAIADVAAVAVSAGDTFTCGTTVVVPGLLTGALTVVPVVGAEPVVLKAPPPPLVPVPVTTTLPVDVTVTPKVDAWKLLSPP